ncbi:winged helix-turn-helix domain-containing protein [Nonomuraea sp. NPDC049709]|uniref:AfsR/SARP family transcriptional regulator n=1 Tax=Nonomuraea sp. NPDC049709 TaxID=3154736 RepID=UPI0034373703
MVAGHAKRRLLIAILLISANRAVSRDALVDALWPDRPINSAKASLKTHVWALLRLLSPADHARAPIVTLPTGCSIRAPIDCLDMLAFERLVAEGREARRRGDVQGALKKLSNATLEGCLQSLFFVRIKEGARRRLLRDHQAGQRVTHP